MEGSIFDSKTMFCLYKLKALFLFFFLGMISCNRNIEEEYYDTGEVFKKIEKVNKKEKITYFTKEGVVMAKWLMIDSIQWNYYLFYKNGEVAENGIMKDFIPVGWHIFYDKDGRRMKDVFYINGISSQVKVFKENGEIDLDESIYTEIYLPTDTLALNQEIEGYLLYYNGKSKYEYVDLYLSKEIDKSFTNVFTVKVDTFWTESNDMKIPFNIRFSKKGKNYIRGYLFDGVLDSLDSNTLNGIRVWVEKEVYVK